MYKVYLIVVCVATAAFVAAYIPANQARAAREQERLIQLDNKMQQEERQRLADEEAARQADRERREQREREEAEREAKKEADELAANEATRASISETLAKVESLSAELERRRKELDGAREARIELQKKVFDGRKANEQFKIELRTAQLEAQRAVDFIAAKTGAQPAILLPPPPPLAPAAAKR